MNPLFPSVEELAKENKAYQAHLDKGGKPIQIITEMQPVEDAQNWYVKVAWPEGLKNKWTKEFTYHLARTIREAIQPPGQKEKPTGKN